PRVHSSYLAALLGWWLLSEMIMVIRHDHVEIKLDNIELNSQLHVAPFNLTQLDGQRLINFVHFPNSFSHKCKNSTKVHLQLLVLVLSAPGNNAARNAIRKLWASPKHSRGVREGKAKHYFIVGNGLRTKSELREEMTKHDDIIIIDVQDSYMNLVYKSFSAVHIAAHLCPALFTLKVDEDTVFHIDRFLEGIQRNFFHKNADLYCYVWVKTLPTRDPNNVCYVSVKQYPAAILPDYCSGPAYVMTRRAARQILNWTHLFPDMQVEDVLLTGIISQKAGVNRHNYRTMFEPDNYFHRQCAPSLIAKHDLKTYAAMRVAWKRMNDPTCF
ncbi:hypothetical protein PENTCL1PPCAC_29541, partial [Pristionchus entomophagus]